MTEEEYEGQKYAESIMMDISKRISGHEVENLRRIHNPNNEPIGMFTGRCARCGSDNLWDDASAYGCNICRAVYRG